MALGYEKRWDQSHNGYFDFCAITFDSPVPNILNTYHHLALRAAVFAAVDLIITQEVLSWWVTRRRGRRRMMR